MRYDQRKIEELHGRVWKRYDFGVMDSLHEKGYITNPARRQEKSVHLTEEGMQLAKRLADDLFGLPGDPRAQ